MRWLKTSPTQGTVRLRVNVKRGLARVRVVLLPGGEKAVKVDVRAELVPVKVDLHPADAKVGKAVRAADARVVVDRAVARVGRDVAGLPAAR